VLDGETVEVDAETARVYSAASAHEQRKLRLLPGFLLSELTARPARPLKEVMDEIGRCGPS